MNQQQQDPAQDKRVLMAVVLSVIVLWFFSNFVFEPPPPPLPEDAPTAATEDGTPAADTPAVALADDDDSAPAAAVAEVPAEPQAPDRILERAWEGVDARFSSLGGGPSSIAILQYSEPYELDWLPSWLISGFTEGFEWEPFSMACPDLPPVDIVKDPLGVLLPVGTDDLGIAGDTGNYRVTVDEPDRVEMTSRRGSLQVTKSYGLPADGYVLDYVVTIKNVGRAATQVTPTFGVADAVIVPEGSRYGPQPETWADVGGDVERMGRRKLDKKGSLSWETDEANWVGVGDKYFVLGLEPEQPLAGVVTMGPAPGDERFAATIETAPVNLGPGEVRSWTFRLWAGPKQLEDLDNADMRLKTSIDFGFFGLFALPILAFLKFIYGFAGSWGISIILLTVAIKLALFPLSQKSYKSMKAMQSLQPEINSLKEKHKEDREALNKEMMELWKKHGVNPAGGCLPMVIQMPIWFALYRVLWNSVELYQTPFLYFCDLSLRDPLGFFPLALGITMWMQQKFTPNTATDPAQQAVIKFMPLFFSVIMFTLPAGLVVYILVNNILSIGQQWIIHRGNDGPAGKGDAAAPAVKGPGSKKK